MPLLGIIMQYKNLHTLYLLKSKYTCLFPKFFILYFLIFSFSGPCPTRQDLSLYLETLCMLTLGYFAFNKKVINSCTRKNSTHWRIFPACYLAGHSWVSCIEQQSISCLYLLSVTILGLFTLQLAGKSENPSPMFREELQCIFFMQLTLKIKIIIRNCATKRTNQDR